jgi:hypothetical protein
MNDHGAAFPPTSALDVFFYDEDEVVAGYRGYRPGDPEPGGNRSPGYRWGWANRRVDSTGEDHGYSHVRREIPIRFEDVFGERSAARHDA